MSTAVQQTLTVPIRLRDEEGEPIAGTVLCRIRSPAGVEGTAAVFQYVDPDTLEAVVGRYYARFDATSEGDWTVRVTATLGALKGASIDLVVPVAKTKFTAP